MSTNRGESVRLLVTYLFMLASVDARPCNEGDFELCFLSRSSISAEVSPDIQEQFSRDSPDEAKTRQIYDIVVHSREMRGIPEDLANCTEEEEVEREDHITQNLSELMVNTDSEITSLQGTDVEEPREEHGNPGKDDGHFALLAGDEAAFEVEGIWFQPVRALYDRKLAR